VVGKSGSQNGKEEEKPCLQYKEEKTHSLEADLWHEIGALWFAAIKSERVKSTHNFGGPIVLKSNFLPQQLAKWLWSYLGNSKQGFPSISLVGPEIEALNKLFGEGKFSISGWCFHQDLHKEIWMVDKVIISYVADSGLLKIKFLCDRKNADGHSFKAR
jgi:hypothetical protein